MVKEIKREFVNYILSIEKKRMNNNYSLSPNQPFLDDSILFSNNISINNNSNSNIFDKSSSSNFAPPNQKD